MSSGISLGPTVGAPGTNASGEYVPQPMCLRNTGTYPWQAKETTRCSPRRFRYAIDLHSALAGSVFNPLSGAQWTPSTGSTWIAALNTALQGALTQVVSGVEEWVTTPVIIPPMTVGNRLDHSTFVVETLGAGFPVTKLSKDIFIPNLGTGFNPILLSLPHSNNSYSLPNPTKGLWTGDNTGNGAMNGTLCHFNAFADIKLGNLTARSNGNGSFGTMVFIEYNPTNGALEVSPFAEQPFLENLGGGTSFGIDNEAYGITASMISSSPLDSHGAYASFGSSQSLADIRSALPSSANNTFTATASVHHAGSDTGWSAIAACSLHSIEAPSAGASIVAKGFTVSSVEPGHACIAATDSPGLSGANALDTFLVNSNALFIATTAGSGTQQGEIRVVKNTFEPNSVKYITNFVGTPLANDVTLYVGNVRGGANALTFKANELAIPYSYEISNSLGETDTGVQSGATRLVGVLVTQCVAKIGATNHFGDARWVIS